LHLSGLFQCSAAPFCGVCLAGLGSVGWLDLAFIAAAYALPELKLKKLLFDTHLPNSGCHATFLFE